MLNSHSGGGSFIFVYLDAVDHIPDHVKRIAFSDSNYGYENSLHGSKPIQWLRSSKQHHLNVLAYNDSIVIYNGKPLVSPTGRTWYRSKLIQVKLSGTFQFKYESDINLINCSTLSNKIDIILKIN